MNRRKKIRMKLRLIKEAIYLKKVIINKERLIDLPSSSFQVLKGEEISNFQEIKRYEEIKNIILNKPFSKELQY